ncbi:MAG: hypothetical protein V3R76_00535, partial [Gammaproteobacteria bacterium]
MARNTPNYGFAHANITPASRKSDYIDQRRIEWFLPLIFLSVIVTLLVGCGGDSGMNTASGGSQSTVAGGSQSGTRQEFTIDQAGGTVVYRSTVQDVIVTLTFPPGALDGTTVISIDHAQNFPAASGLVAGAVFEFGPDGMVFNIPVELSIDYSANMIGTLSETDFRIHEANGSNWVPLLGAVDTSNRIVSTSINEFSIYGLKTIPNGGTDPGTDPGTGGGVGASGNPDATLAWVQSNVFGGVCSGCHSGEFPMGGVNWSSESNTCSNVGRASSQISTLMEIDSGNPDGSHLIWKLEGQGPNGESLATGTGQMPLYG